MSVFHKIQSKLKLYFPLIKSLQTSLLVLTGFTGFISARCPYFNIGPVFCLIGSLFLAVSGSTVLNMVYDRDIDLKMRRTALRPLPSGSITMKEALILGLILSFAGLVWAYSLSRLFSLVIFLGLFIDVVIYTVWLKRRTPWSIIWGGLSGALPILAGRILGLGYIDWIGVLLGLSILLWIPTHIMTFSMRYNEDYRRAGIPTFPSAYGNNRTRFIIAAASIGAAVSIFLGFTALGMAQGYLGLLIILIVIMFGLAVWSVIRPSDKINFRLFKYASLYMLSAMLLLMIGVLQF